MTQERKYYIDWLRIMLIISVFFYHIGMIFNGWGWHIKSDTSYSFLHPIMSFLHLWRMPLLFLVSGAGTYFALGKRSSGQYVKERTRRLFVPFVAGIFLLVPVQVYIEKIANYDSLLAYYPNMFDGIYPVGNFSWHHLWFLAYLFLISLIIAPFLTFLRTRIKKGNIARFFAMRAGMNWILVFLIASQVLLRPIFPESTHALYNDWAYFTMYLIYFLAGFMFVSQDGITGAIERDRKIYLVQTVVFLSMFWFARDLFGSGTVGDYYDGILRIVLAWSCSLAVLGYTKKYLNGNRSWRKPMNEAIYPFYLLHQPAIVVVGYSVLQWGLADGLNAVIITLSSLIAIIGIYILIVRPFNLTRIIFGLKVKKKEKVVEEASLEPVAIETK